MNRAVAAARAALAGESVWIVGGAVRDRFLGRATDDVDLVAVGDVEPLARRLAKAKGAAAFPLSEEFGAWRVAERSGAWQADLMPLEGETIEQDLARRDFTVNAMAEPLEGGDVVDPFGGRSDLEARCMRLVSEAALDDDPLRVLRLVRLSTELEFTWDPALRDLARRAAARLGEVPGERTFGELKRIVGGPVSRFGLPLLADVGALDAVLPELANQRGVEQNRYHHLDVYGHSMAALLALTELEADPSPLGEHGGAAMAVLAEPFADDLTRGQALRFAALLHDAAKPETRGQTPEGRVTFIGHDERGAEMARAALGRLRASERLQAFVAELTRHHLRLGFLVHRAPLSRREVHAYLRACEPVEVEVTVMSVADRLATRGDKSQEAIPKHLILARELLGEALRWRAEGPPEPLVRGDFLAGELGIAPGPELGRVMRELEAAQFADEIGSQEEAVARAREVLASA